MKKNKISVEQVMKLEDVISYLEELVKGFKAGKIVVEHEGRTIVAKPSEVVEVEIEVKQKPDKEKFSLELSWHPELIPEEEKALKISQEEPSTLPAKEEGTKSVVEIPSSGEKKQSTATDKQDPSKSPSKSSSSCGKKA